jgi:hypothetical protein
MRGSFISRALIIAAALAFSSVASTSVFAQAPAAHYTTADTDIGTLLDDPAARAVLDKHIPGFSKRDQIDMARSMTLKGIQPYDSATITDKALADIDADLAKLPAKK